MVGYKILMVLVLHLYLEKLKYPGDHKRLLFVICFVRCSLDFDYNHAPILVCTDNLSLTSHFLDFLPQQCHNSCYKLLQNHKCNFWQLMQETNKQCSQQLNFYDECDDT